MVLNYLQLETFPLEANVVALRYFNKENEVYLSFFGSKTNEDVNVRFKFLQIKLTQGNKIVKNDFSCNGLLSRPLSKSIKINLKNNGVQFLSHQN